MVPKCVDGGRRESSRAPRSSSRLPCADIGEGLVGEPHRPAAATLDDVGHSGQRTQIVSLPVEEINSVLISAEVVPVPRDQAVAVIYTVRIGTSRRPVRGVVSFDSIGHLTVQVNRSRELERPQPELKPATFGRGVHAAIVASGETRGRLVRQKVCGRTRVNPIGVLSHSPGLAAPAGYPGLDGEICSPTPTGLYQLFAK